MDSDTKNAAKSHKRDARFKNSWSDSYIDLDFEADDDQIIDFLDDKGWLCIVKVCNKQNQVMFLKKYKHVYLVRLLIFLVLR